jgi:hypothetical protein
MANVDVTILLDTTGSNYQGIMDARSVLPSRLVDALLSIPNVNVGVSYTTEYPVGSYGSSPDRPFTGVAEPSTTAATLYSAISNAAAGGGGDAPDAMVEGLSALVGLPLTTYSSALTCSSGRVPGGCWRTGARRFVILLTDDIFHNGPDPVSGSSVVYSPYTGIAPTPYVWTDVLLQMRSSNTMLFIMNTNASGATSEGAPQYRVMLTDLGQPTTDAYLAYGAGPMQTASDQIVARIRAIAGL